MRNIWFLLLALCCSAAGAQTLPSLGLKTDNQQLVEDAVKGGMVLVRQSFQLRQNSTGQLFGSHNNEEFGTDCSLAVLVNGGVLVTDRTAHPWAYDERVAKYLADYTPVPLRTYVSRFGVDGGYEEQPLGVDSVGGEAGSLAYILPTGAFGGAGFEPDTATTERKGWLVWVVSDKGYDLANGTNADFVVQRYTVAGGSVHDGMPLKTLNTSKTLLGGVFVVPSYEGVGKVVFRLCGMAVRRGDAWLLAVPGAKVAAVDGMQQPDGSELTHAVGDKAAVGADGEAAAGAVSGSGGDASDSGRAAAGGHDSSSKKRKDKKKI